MVSHPTKISLGATTLLPHSHFHLMHVLGLMEQLLTWPPHKSFLLSNGLIRAGHRRGSGPPFAALTFNDMVIKGCVNAGSDGYQDLTVKFSQILQIANSWHSVSIL